MRALIVALALVASPAARADGQALGDLEGRARAHFEAGRALYALGNYQDALREFTSGYQLSPRPKFLLNLAYTYRKLGDPRHAREMLAQYLVRGELSPADRVEVDELIAELDRQIVELDRDRQTTPPAPVVIVKPTPPPPRKKFIERHWWIIPVSVVAAAGIAVGIYFGTRPTIDCGTLGCVPMGR
jgi:tetratricopeptide (TPR) repeat protein